MWHGSQWFSHKMNNQHPLQLKKSKSWEPFWSYQLNSTANLVNLAQFWGKWAGLSTPTFSLSTLWKTVRLHGKKLQNATNPIVFQFRLFSTIFHKSHLTWKCLIFTILFMIYVLWNLQIHCRSGENKLLRSCQYSSLCSNDCG